MKKGYTDMVAAEYIVVGFSAVVNAILSALVGLFLWQRRKAAKEKETYRDKTDELRGIIKGVGESDTEITEGLLHLVEQHDKELDHAAEERAEMRRRIKRLEERVQRRLEYERMGDAEDSEIKEDEEGVWSEDHGGSPSR
jgi:biopolymer transport protein ExbB/TolQ